MKKKQILNDLKNDLKEACWIGEDGSMVTKCKTKRGAWLKFRKLIREEVGDIEAEEVKMEDIGIAFARLATEEEIKEDNEASWFVVDEPGENRITVWYYST